MKPPKRLMSLLPSHKQEAPLTVEESVAVLRQDVAAYFHGSSSMSTYKWPEKKASVFYPEDVYVRVAGQVLGYIQYIVIDGPVARIENIACETAYVRQGVTAAIAKAFAQEVDARYGVSVIVFEEKTDRYEEKGYSGLFAKIGTTPLPLKAWQKKGRNDYQWGKANW